MANENKLEIQNVFKIFGSSLKLERKALALAREGLSRREIYEKTGCLVAVRDVTLEVQEGERLVLMGLSGSGKSSLLRCLNGLHKISEGSLLVDGVDISSFKEKELLNIRKTKFGMVFQQFGLLPHRTVLGNVLYGLELQNVAKKTREEKAKEVIELVGLSGYEKMYIGELSGGMQQRVGIARALAINPDILLMDEAFSALDPVLRVEMQKELLYLQKKLRKTLVFVTHDMEEAIRLGDRIAIMQDGQIIQIGTPSEILLHPTSDFIREFTANINPFEYLKLQDIMTPSELGAEEMGQDIPSLSWQDSIPKAGRLFLLHDKINIINKNGLIAGSFSRAQIANLLQKDKFYE